MLTRRIHKWLALIVGIQALIWAISGLYMVAIDIDVIHGDHFIRSGEQRPVPVSSIIDPVAAAQAFPGARAVKFHWVLDRPTYIVSTGAGRVLLDAVTGKPLPPPTKAQVRQLADHWFTGEERIFSVLMAPSTRAPATSASRCC